MRKYECGDANVVEDFRTEFTASTRRCGEHERAMQADEHYALRVDGGVALDLLGSLS